MIANAIVATTVICLALGLFLMQECRFLIPYRHVIFMKYGEAIALFALTFFVNVFAAVYMTARLVFLKDTGKKLAHLEKQLRTGTSLSDELHRRLKE